MRLQATAKWMHGPRRLVAGTLGVAERPLGASGNFSQAMGDWLVQMGYAIALTQPVAPPPVAAIPPTPDPPVADPMAALVDFFNTATAAAIARKVSGIGPKTAKEIVDARPLTWETLRSLLSASQAEAAAQAFDVTIPAEEDPDHELE